MKNRTFLIIGLVPAILVCIAAYLFLPQFVNMYSAFGATLPLQSQLLFRFYRGILIFPVLVLVMWFLWPKTLSRDVVVLVFGVSGSVVLIAFGIWAAYAPLILLGTQK